MCYVSHTNTNTSTLSHRHTHTRHTRAIHRHIQSHIPSHWPRTHCVGGQKRKLRVMGRGEEWDRQQRGSEVYSASQGREQEEEAAKRITRIHKRGDRQSQVASSCLPLSVCLPPLPAIAARGVCLWSARSSCCQFVCQITKTPPLPHRHRYAPRDASSDAPARTFHQYILPSVCACVCVYF